MFFPGRLSSRTHACRARTGAGASVVVIDWRRRAWLARVQVTHRVFGLLLNPVVCVAPHIILCHSFEDNKRSVYSIFPSLVSGLLRFRLGQTTKQLALIIDISTPDDGDWIVSPSYTYSPDDLAPPTVCDNGVPLPVLRDWTR